jgi:HAD superfamily hydrolase (TIGR01509 family)
MERVIRAVVFDAGGVLFRVGAYIASVAERFSVAPQDLAPLFVGPTGAENRIEATTYEIADLRPLMLEGLPASLTDRASELVDALLQVYRDPAIGQVNDELLELITQIRANGVLVGVLSNGPRDNAEMQEALVFSRSPVDAWVLSGRDGVGKPDPAAFQLIASRLGVEPSDCFFIDDGAQHVEAAERVGMLGFHFTGEVEPLRSVLAAAGIVLG